MTDLIPFNSDHGEVRAVMRDDAPWFVATDVATILGYRDASNMVRNLDQDEADTHNVSTLGGRQAMLIISESGLYNAIFRSRRPEARAFRRWVTGEVLPALRRSGTYSIARSPLLRLEAALEHREHITTIDAAEEAGIGTDPDGLAMVAGFLRGMGWKRGWIAPEKSQ